MSGYRRQSRENPWREGHGFGFYMGRVRLANTRVFELFKEMAESKITNRDAMDFNPNMTTRMFFSPWTPGRDYFNDRNFDKLSGASAGIRGINSLMRRLGAHDFTRYLSADGQFPEGWPHDD